MGMMEPKMETTIWGLGFIFGRCHILCVISYYIKYTEPQERVRVEGPGKSR